MLAVRRQHPVLSMGSLQMLHPGNPSIFAYVRKLNDDIVLVVNNLSARAQAAELDLGEYEGMVPVELLGRERFPQIGKLPYLLTFVRHGFYWFQLISESSRDD